MTFQAPHPEVATMEAVRASHSARRLRAEATATRRSSPATAADWDREASALETIAVAALEPQQPLARGRGGEVVPPNEAGAVRSHPAVLEAEASEKRLQLLGADGVLALDIAESIGAADSVEKMLAHQLAKAHESAMYFANQAKRLAQQAERLMGLSPFGTSREAVNANIEACRSAAISARLMETFQGGVVALARKRSGGKQVVIVQHMHVADGGQAVVAGSISTGGSQK